MIAVLRSPKLSPFSWRERPRMSPEMEKGRDGQEKRGSLSRAPSSLPGRLMILWAHPQVDGILEDWIWEMVAALKSQLAQPVNVGLAEWVTLAHNHYTTAVRNTRLVGQEIAALLQWLQVRPAPTSLLSSPFPSLLAPLLFYIFSAFRLTYFSPAGLTFYSLLGKFAFFPL